MGLAMTIPSQGPASATSGYRSGESYELTQANHPVPVPYNGDHRWRNDCWRDPLDAGT